MLMCGLHSLIDICVQLCWVDSLGVKIIGCLSLLGIVKKFSKVVIPIYMLTSNV